MVLVASQWRWMATSGPSRAWEICRAWRFVDVIVDFSVGWSAEKAGKVCSPFVRFNGCSSRRQPQPSTERSNARVGKSWPIGDLLVEIRFLSDAFTLRRPRPLRRGRRQPFFALYAATFPRIQLFVDNSPGNSFTPRTFCFVHRQPSRSTSRNGARTLSDGQGNAGSLSTRSANATLPRPRQLEEGRVVESLSLVRETGRPSLWCSDPACPNCPPLSAATP